MLFQIEKCVLNEEQEDNNNNRNLNNELNKVESDENKINLKDQNLNTNIENTTNELLIESITIQTNSSSDSTSSQNENTVRIEDGYATRQMDEYFRQTIAQIKEELEKKLQHNEDTNEFNLNNNNNNNNNNDANVDLINAYDSQDNQQKDLQTNNEQLTCFCGELKKRPIAKLGYLVIFFSFLNNFLIDGFLFSYSYLFKYFKTQFSTHNSYYSYFISSLPYSILVCFYLLFTPISLYLNKKYSLRLVASIGTLISFVSLLVSSFLIQNYYLFILFFSFFNSLGLNLTYISSILILKENYLIVLCASSIGFGIYPLIINFLLDYYKLNDAIFLIAAIHLHCLIGSISFGQQQQSKSTFKKCSTCNSNSLSNDFNSIISTPNSIYNKNYSLKQHWRRFCQTRKQNTQNKKKNLFDLIAEEKEKTRALSKHSLEDGCYITTSNNLLAPDENNVIVPRRSQIPQQMTTSTRTTPKFFTRLANSIKSLVTFSSTKSNSNSNNNLNDGQQVQIPLQSLFIRPSNNEDNQEEEEEDDGQLQSLQSSRPSRYVSYRNSLTNSVKGSLVEFSVPEYDEESITQNDSVSQHGTPIVRNKHRPKRQFRDNQSKPANNIKSINSKKLTYATNIESSSLFNLPFNINSTYFNLNNPLKLDNKGRIRGKMDVNLIRYLKYLFNFKLITNSFIALINISLFLSSIGMFVPLIYLIEYLNTDNTNIQNQFSLKIYSLIGLSSIIGRFVSTILYKNDNSKSTNRILAYNSSLALFAILTSLLILCKKPFPIILFSFSYGFLFGFILSLRPLFILDLIGLNSSDDSLFSILSIGQMLGLTIGPPIAGCIVELWKNLNYVYYFSSICVLLGVLLTILGKQLQAFCICSYKSLNKHYINSNIYF